MPILLSLRPRRGSLVPQPPLSNQPPLDTPPGPGSSRVVITRTLSRVRRHARSPLDQTWGLR